MHHQQLILAIQNSKNGHVVDVQVEKVQMKVQVMMLMIL
jgi:hypothetical protein